jgi:imidazolonepropionase-like amidohydrolase
VIQGDLMFYRAGGLLVAGTDPTAGGGVIAGFSNHRQFELMVEGGFTPLEAIKVMTLNGAIYMERDKLVGSIAAGKQADLVVIAGDPSTRASDINNVETVFKQGVGYDPAKLIASVMGKTGLW